MSRPRSRREAAKLKRQADSPQWDSPQSSPQSDDEWDDVSGHRLGEENDDDESDTDSR